MPEVVCPQCAHPCEQGHKFCPVCGFPIAELGRNKSNDDPLIGTTLPGGYVILELVGVGGMGRVYRAEQKALGRTVAVKIIHPHLLGDESASVRFITEARAASRLNHPNSVAVIDFGKNGGQLYLVMEYLRGKDLARVVYEEGPIPFKRIVDVLCQVLAALGEAHHLDIIHRDLKPENIVLEPMRSGGDFVKVVDFGLAKMKAEVTATNITMPGIVCGTPDYMAPEQGRGDTIDHRSDLYACGVILFQLLTGRLPFEAETPTQVVLMHLSLPPPDPSVVAPERDIPEGLVEVTLKALSKDPARRFQDAEEFSSALRASLNASEGTSGRYSNPDGGVVCNACRALVPRGQKFCGDCGARIAMPSTPPPRTDGLVARRPRLSSLPRVPLPFTGREEDLAWLERARRNVSGSLSAVRLVGDHGVGKTRLLREFLRGAASAGDVIVTVGPDPWWAEVGNHALRKAIIELAGLPANGGSNGDWPGATPEARRGLSDLFTRAMNGRESRSPFWARPTNGALTPGDRRFIAAEALRWAIMRAQQNSSHRAGSTRGAASRGAPRVILAIDDLHVLDGGSRAALADVIGEPPLAAMLIVATHVPGFDPGWQPQAASEPSPFVEEPSGESSSTRWLSGLPTTVAASLVKGVTPRLVGPSGAEGPAVPPLYIDQLIRFNMEGGSDPPARMADIIALRIERLPIEARRTLQAVAVIGDAADHGSLRCLLPDVRSFDELLATLSVAGLVEERDGIISTMHPLVRDVTLATIPAGVRRDLHARATTDQHGDPLPLPLEVQALHAYHAQNSFEALMLLEQVADRAASRGDQPGCVLALRRGLDLARREIFRGELDDPMRAVLIFSRKLGEALARAGDLTDADGVLREALDLAGPSGKDRAMVLGSLAFVARERDRATEATVYLREALELAKQSAANDLVSSLENMRREWMTR
ncbi:serine/threonine protein kinase [Minicystis rosea]|nr:serine/threonine protein kinase [Minicystis rosea]